MINKRHTHGSGETPPLKACNRYRYSGAGSDFTRVNTLGFSGTRGLRNPERNKWDGGVSVGDCTDRGESYDWLD